jgi:SNF2 family DNA or RNA helicase
MEFLKNYAKSTDLFDLKGYLFGAAPGTGKTISSLGLHVCLNNDLAIVTAPLVAIQDVWVNTVESVFKKPQKVWHSLMDSQPTGQEDIIIVHYEYLKKLIEFLPLFRHRRVTHILDESHNFNSIGTLRSDLYIQLTQQANCNDVLWLSGTPIKALPIEAAPLIQCIDRRFTDDVFARFKRIYAGASNQALEILQHRLGIVSMYVKKDVLSLEPPIFRDIQVSIPNSADYTLPAIRAEMVKFTQQQEAYYAARRPQDEAYFYDTLKRYSSTLKADVEKQEYAAYRRSLEIVIRSGGAAMYKDEIFACNAFEAKRIIPMLSPEDKKIFKDVRSVVKYVKLKIQGECLGRVVGGLRIKCSVDMARVFDFAKICESSLKKTVVFTSFVQVLEAGIENVKKNTTYTPLSAYAANSHQLPQTVDLFYKDENANPLFATYKTLSTAVPLTAADLVVIFDAPFRDYILQQAIARVHRDDSRPGHIPSQVYVYLVSLNTGSEVNISSRSFDILKWSQEQVQAITGVKSPFDITDQEQANEAALEAIGARIQAFPIELSW